MRELAAICIRRPVFATMLILALVVVGAAGYSKLGVDRFPPVDMPTVRVSTTLPGASPAEVEALVSDRIEEAVNTVEGIEELRSISSPGRSFIMVTFRLDRNIDAAAQDVRDRVSTVMRDLPREADPPEIAKFDNDLAPVLSIAISAPRSHREITELADKVIKPQLERSVGVGEVELVGGLERAINIWVDAERLAAYQLPVTAVREAIVRQNANVPAGNVTSELTEAPIRTLGRITEPRGFDDLVISTQNGSPLRIKDVGWTEDGTRERRSYSTLNGVPTVLLEIRRQSGANTVQVIEALKERLEAVKAQLPPDVKLEVIRDQSRYIYEALHEINIHLIAGSILASLVAFAFMRNWRATIIAAVAIPASVISTFGMMWALDFTLNSVTMLSLVLMVGIVIDDAIVVLENVFRWVEEKKMSPMDAAREGTAEIALPVLATTLSLVVIFVPVSFMSSISGRFLFQFGITAAVAVMVSLLVSFTLTPMMCSRLIRVNDSQHGSPASRRGFYARLDAWYSRSLVWALGHRVIILFIAGLVMLSSWPLYKMVKQEYIPAAVDEGEFSVDARAQEGTSLAAMESSARLIDETIRSVPGVRVSLMSIGSGFMNSPSSVRFFIMLAPHKERHFSLGRLWSETLKGNPLNAWKGNYTQLSVMQEIRNRLKKFKEVRISVRNMQSFNLGGSPSEVDLALLGPDLETLGKIADDLRARSDELGIQDADTTLRLDKPEFVVHIDRARAANLGVSTEDISTALRIMVGGEDRVSRFRDPSLNEDYYVQLRLTEQDRTDPNVISRLYVPRDTGGLVRLDNLVQIAPAQTASRIDRLDRQRAVNLRGSVAPGYALADRMEALRGAVDEMNLPPGYTTKVVGRGRELERTFNEFLWAFLLSILFMYMILASQFESSIHPITILLSLPLALPFALLSLWATGNSINLYSALGILVLFGVVKKNSILQIDHMNKLVASGLERTAAILQGNRERLRPILMTTLALVAGMLPLAIGTGPGSEERRAIAVVVIGGQTLSLFLTLVVTPVAYSVIEEMRQRRGRPGAELAAAEARPQGA